MIRLTSPSSSRSDYASWTSQTSCSSPMAQAKLGPALAVVRSSVARAIAFKNGDLENRIRRRHRHLRASEREVRSVEPGRPGRHTHRLVARWRARSVGAGDTDRVSDAGPPHDLFLGGGLLSPRYHRHLTASCTRLSLRSSPRPRLCGVGSCDYDDGRSLEIRLRPRRDVCAASVQRCEFSSKRVRAVEPRTARTRSPAPIGIDARLRRRSGNKPRKVRGRLCAQPGDPKWLGEGIGARRPR
jgi:hypothetical protein